MSVKTLKERFESKYRNDPATGCWLWEASKDHRGYGQISSGGRLGKMLRAHRVSYELYKGPIPDGLLVLHKCDNRNCVSPNHLFLGTQLDNIMDMNNKGRRITPDRAGENNPRAKLTIDDIRYIRQNGVTPANQKILAVQYGCSYSHINNIINYNVWRNV